MTQHHQDEQRPTPGPWNLDSVTCHGEVVDQYGITIADVCGAPDDEQSANARLIVAACNAVQQAADRIGMNPVDLARWLEAEPGAIVNGYHETPTEIDQ